MSAENLLRILDEITKIEQFFGHELYDTLIENWIKIKGGLSEEIIDALTDSYHELYELVVKRFEVLSNPCISAASEKISQRLYENMQQFKHIAGIYRLTNKKAPNKPSEYTNVTYKPVENLTSKDFFIHLSPKLKIMLLNSIFQKSLIDLYEVANKMLEEEKLKSNSLSKFSKDGNTKNTDYDNIWIQIYLDVKELENQIDKMGGSREYPELQNLYTLVSNYMGPGFIDIYK